MEDLDPKFCAVDFEIAFFCQVVNHLPGVDLIGCLFHWNQAIRRKLFKLGKPENEVGFAMRKGVLDLLEISPKDEVHPKETTFVAGMIYDYISKFYGKVTIKFEPGKFEADVKCRKKAHGVTFGNIQNAEEAYLDDREEVTSIHEVEECFDP